MIYITEGIILALILVVTYIHAVWYADNKPIPWWWHSIWVIPFIAIMVCYYIKSHDILGTAIIGIERLIFYNVILNLFRHKTFFYLDGESTNGSWWDRQLEKLDGAWEYIWFFLFVGFILIQFKL